MLLQETTYVFSKRARLDADARLFGASELSSQGSQFGAELNRWARRSLSTTSESQLSLAGRENGVDPDSYLRRGAERDNPTFHLPSRGDRDEFATL
jgi:hypothetical protein